MLGRKFSLFKKIICLLVILTLFLSIQLLQKIYNSNTPKQHHIIHQTWKDSKLPPRFQRWSRSFKVCHPDWEYKLWTDKDNDELIRRHFPWFWKTYAALNSGVMRSDAARLFYVYKYGGVYCDLDCECLQPFVHLFENVSLAFGAMAGHTVGKTDKRYVDEGQIENSFMYSLPGHPFILRVIKAIQNKKVGTPEATTGPYAVMEEINALRREKNPPLTFMGKTYLKIFPHSYFNPFSWLLSEFSACKDFGKFTREEEESCKEHHRNSSYILQYHVQSWSNKGKPNIGKP